MAEKSKVKEVCLKTTSVRGKWQESISVSTGKLQCTVEPGRPSHPDKVGVISECF